MSQSSSAGNFKLRMWVTVVSFAPASFSVGCGEAPASVEVGESRHALLDPPAPPATGAYQSGVYRNLFKEWNPALTDGDDARTLGRASAAEEPAGRKIRRQNVLQRLGHFAPACPLR